MNTDGKKLVTMQGAWATQAEAEAYLRTTTAEFPAEQKAAMARGEHWQVVQTAPGVWTLGRYLPAKGRQGA